ncbi:Transcriptional regulator ATRX, partial [Lamellibrachia satsuma]
DDDDDNPNTTKRKKIRKILKSKKLSEQTVAATKAEEDRRKRIKERQELVTVEDANSPTKCPKTTKLVLEMDPETKEPIIEVHKDLICLLKPHQVEAVKFLWDCCAESLELLKNDEGSGCILAHCMGLGKTLSVITFLHTLMSYGEKTGVRCALIVCPLNTVLNWEVEWGKWLAEEEQFDVSLVYEMSSVKNTEMRADVLRNWQEDGGILIIGYEMYRNLSQHRNIRNKRLKKIFTETLVDPGPDFVVCDEGHILKNEMTAVSKALNAVRTRRRVVLTGTPLQNNLIEYHCMVNFVKPNLLGSKKEFCNRFVNPITNGQCADSTEHDVKIMKRRAHVLHETLAGCVQRRDYSALTKFLMPKHEYVLAIRLSPVQIELYEKYLENASGSGPMKLFSDYQALMRIWTHPWVLRLDEVRQMNKV